MARNEDITAVWGALVELIQELTKLAKQANVALAKDLNPPMTMQGAEKKEIARCLPSVHRVSNASRFDDRGRIIAFRASTMCGRSKGMAKKPKNIARNARSQGSCSQSLRLITDEGAAVTCKRCRQWCERFEEKQAGKCGGLSVWTRLIRRHYPRGCDGTRRN